MPTQASLAVAFKAFDTDNSGTLSAEEMLKVLTRKGGGAELSIEDAKAVIASVDYNGDGVLDVRQEATLSSLRFPRPAPLVIPPLTARVRFFDSRTHPCSWRSSRR